MSEPQINEWFVRIWLINYQYEIILSSSYFRLKVLQIIKNFRWNRYNIKINIYTHYVRHIFMKSNDNVRLYEICNKIKLDNKIIIELVKM